VKLKTVALVGMVALLGSVGYGQSPASTPVAVSAPADIYANFVGTWVGTTRVLREGAELTQPLRVEVTEDANRTHLRFFFSYSQQGEDGFEHVTRVATFDTAKNEMTWQQADDPEAPDALQHTAGLNAFAEKGYGAFNASYEIGVGNHHVVNRCTYVLHPDMFGYVWYESMDGKPFQTYSVTKLTRENTARASVTKPVISKQ
jgi:hypothetical protein